MRGKRGLISIVRTPYMIRKRGGEAVFGATKRYLHFMCPDGSC